MKPKDHKDIKEDKNKEEKKRRVVKMANDAHKAMEALYRKGFDPATYLQLYYTPPRADLSRADGLSRWEMERLYRAFNEGDVGGELLVDIGSGPTLDQVMSGCEKFNTVFLTDYLEVNRNELKSWIQNDGKCNLDWSPFFKFACQLEGKEPTAWEQKAARLRQVVKGVLPVDIHAPQPLGPDAIPPKGADCVVSCFCLESASLDLPTFSKALGNVAGLIKPGGHILLIGTIGMSSYECGPNEVMPTFPLLESELCASLKENGFQLIRLEFKTMEDEMASDTDNGSGLFFVKAKKA